MYAHFYFLNFGCVCSVLDVRVCVGLSLLFPSSCPLLRLHDLQRFTSAMRVARRLLLRGAIIRLWLHSPFCVGKLACYLCSFSDVRAMSMWACMSCLAVRGHVAICTQARWCVGAIPIGFFSVYLFLMLCAWHPLILYLWRFCVYAQVFVRLCAYSCVCWWNLGSLCRLPTHTHMATYTHIQTHVTKRSQHVQQGNVRAHCK